MKGCIVTIDNREPSHIQSLKWDGALVTVSQLEYGDVKVITPKGETILIERKTPRDLLDSIKDRRLFNQVSGLVAGVGYCYLVVEGIFIPYHKSFSDSGCWVRIDDAPPQDTSWDWPALQGALLSIQELGCPIVYDPDFHGAVKRLVNRSRNEVKVPPQREAHVFSPEETFFTSLPGIGSKKAIDLVAAFPKPGYALEWLSGYHDEVKVPGIGKGIRQNINEFLGGKMELRL